MYFLVHVPKCAGTTLELHFADALGDGFLIAPRWNSFARNIVGNRYPYARNDPRLAPVRVVSGHSLSASLKRFFPNAEIRETVLLREPESFFVSNYNYRWRRFELGGGPAPGDFEAWYDRQRRNPLSRFLLVRYFEQGAPAMYRLSSAGRLDWLTRRLRDFWFVGGYRRASELAAAISRELGVSSDVRQRNVARTKVVTEDALPGSVRDRIRRENRIDQALYEHALHGFDHAVDAARDLSRVDQAALLRRDLASGIHKLF